MVAYMVRSWQKRARKLFGIKSRTKRERTFAYLFKIRRALSRNIGDDMAIYHLSVKTGSRGGGQSAKAKSDYIEREGKYEKDRDELAYSESGNMPEWAGDDPREYWAAADEHERANGSLFKEVEFALPVELDERQQRELASSFAADLTGGERLPYTMAIHRGGGDNPHVHLMISERGLDGHARDAEQWFKRANKAKPEKGGALKTRSLNKEWLANTRQAWETAANGALERAGRSERIDHRSLAAQREEAIERGQVNRADELNRQPGVHLGPERHRAQRGGPSRVVELAERIEQSNRADRAEREQERPRPAADEKAIADIAAEIAGIEARLKEIYDRTRAAIDKRLEQVGRAIRAGADAVGRAGEDLVRAGSGVGRAIQAGADAVGRTGRAFAGGHQDIRTAIRERSEAPEGPISGVATAVKQIRKGTPVVRAASQEGDRATRALNRTHRSIGRSIVACRRFDLTVHQFSGELELVASLTRAEADQKRKSGDQVGRVEGPIESLLQEKKREYLQREAEQERRYTESKAAFVRSLDDPYKTQTWDEKRLGDMFQREYPTEANSLRTAAIEQQREREQQHERPKSRGYER